MANDSNQPTDEYKDLVAQLLCVDPDDRITIPGILQHPWLLKEGPLLTSADNVFSSKKGLTRLQLQQADNLDGAGF